MRDASKKKLAPLASFMGKKSSDKKTGGKRKSKKGAQDNQRLTADEVTLVFRNLSTLSANGVPLPKAIGALAQESALEHRRGLLESLRRRIESGDTFSNALADHESSFDKITVSQIRVGERSGELAQTLITISQQREKAGKTRQEVIKKLAYPAALLLFGIAVVGFLLSFVVPTFEETYRSANVALPAITQVLIVAGNIVQGYWWSAAGIVAVAILVLQQLRNNEKWSLWLDQQLLKMPLVGPWLLDVALLQLMDTLSRLMDAGFTLAESLGEAGESVSNREMKRGVSDLSRAVQQGERFSREIERNSELFPPMISQLVIVGEQSGKLTQTTRQIRDLLQEEIQRKAVLAIGIIEPVLTITMAGAVAVILLAIYLPMFDMVNTVTK